MNWKMLVSCGLAATAASAAFGFGSAEAQRLPRNAFVDRSVDSVGALLNEVRNDPAVANRYMRHFGMSRSQLLSYLAGLHRERLAEAQTFTVYSVPKDGVVKMHTETFPKGEPVFADSSGKPILLVKCGNPLTLGPVTVIKPNEVESAGKEQGPADLTAMMTSPEETGPPVEMALMTPPTPLMAATPTIPVAPTTPVAETPSERPNVFTGGSSPSFPFFALPLLGGLGAAIASSGGGHHTPPGAVPEPAAYAALMIGLGGLAGRRFTRR